MEKETYQKSKIRPFPTLEERKRDAGWKESFRRQLHREVKEWEEELENDPELDNVDASPELFERIVAQLKAEGKWEDEAAERKEAGKRTAREKMRKRKKEFSPIENGEEIAEELTPDIYALLSEKDREALKIGRKVQRQGRIRKVSKLCGVAVAAIVCVFLVTMSSEANRRYAVGVINRITGNKWGIYIEDSNRDTMKYSEDERKAYQDIEEQLGISVPQMQYRPEGMKFQGYQVSKDRASGAIFYKYKGNIMTLHLYERGENTTMQQTLDAQLIDEISIEGMETEARIYKLKDTEESSYLGEIAYNNCYSVIFGKMEKGEFQKVLQNIIF